MNVYAAKPRTKGPQISRRTERDTRRMGEKYQACRPGRPEPATLHNISYRTLLSPASGQVIRPAHTATGTALPLRDLDLAGFELPNDLAEGVDELALIHPGLLEGEVQLEGPALGLVDEREAVLTFSLGLS